MEHLRDIQREYQWTILIGIENLNLHMVEGREIEGVCRGEEGEGGEGEMVAG